MTEQASKYSHKKLAKEIQQGHHFSLLQKTSPVAIIHGWGTHFHGHLMKSTLAHKSWCLNKCVTIHAAKGLC